MTDPAGRTPVTIVTGFLGSGKTTLLNHVLSAGGLGRVAALINDFGAINIDAALVASVTDDVVQLSNGCVCCTINGDLLAATERVLALEPAVDRIVVETTGLADPLPVGLTFLQTELRARTCLDAMISVVDCSNFALDIFQIDAALAQIVHGDIIVFNKTDLAGEEAICALEARVAIVKPRARTLRAVRGQVPLAAVIGQSDGGSGLRPERAVLPAHLSASGFRAHVHSFDRPLVPARFQQWLDRRLPPGVFRAKGLIRFEGDDNGYVFQLSGTRAAFEPFAGAPPGARLVFIGRDVDDARLGRELAVCQAEVRAGSPSPTQVGETS